MTKEEFFKWERFAASTQYLLDHPNTPEPMCEAIANFIDSILPDERAGAHYSRRLLAMGESLLDENQEPRKNDDGDYDGWCCEFGDNLSEILQFDETPKSMQTAADELFAHFEQWAKDKHSSAVRRSLIRTLLPELLSMASYSMDEKPAKPARTRARRA